MTMNLQGLRYPHNGGGTSFRIVSFNSGLYRASCHSSTCCGSGAISSNACFRNMTPSGPSMRLTIPIILQKEFHIPPHHRVPRRRGGKCLKECAWTFRLPMDAHGGELCSYIQHLKQGQPDPEVDIHVQATRLVQSDTAA